ncbi:MAG: penicillin-binding protein activator [Gammaproteobacteria bacterium]|nr:penicillin-binding protein activator [Gammaproteobacteria bacterium]
MTIKHAFLGAISLAVVAGCVTSPSYNTAPSSTVQQANSMIAEGNPLAAANFLLNAASRATGKEQANLYIRAASAYLDAGETTQAKSVLAQVDTTDATLNAIRGIELARIAVLEGRYQEALALLPSVPSNDTNLITRRAVTESAAQEGLGNLAQALQLRLQLDGLPNLNPTLQLQNHRAVWRILSQVPYNQRESLASSVSHVDITGWLLLLNAYNSGAQRDQMVSQWKARFSVHPAATSGFVDQIATMGVNADVSAIGSGAVAILLPITGRAANFSNEIAKGAMGLAEREGFSGNLFTVDTNNGVQTAVIEATQRGAQAIIGPLTKDNVSAIMVMAERTVPAIALNDLGYPSQDGSVIQFGLNPENEGEDAADFAIKNGRSRAYIIAPANISGDRITSAFASTFEAMGGSVVGETRFDPNGVDFSQSIRQASGSIAGADMIFMPARRQAARLLGAQLKFEKINLPIIATSRINEGRFDARLDGELIGLMFNDAPAIFEGRYSDVSNDAARLRAFGADALRLANAAPSLVANPQQSIQGESGSLRIDGGLRVRRILDWGKFTPEGIDKIAFGSQR